ncbi:MAG: UvrD-helicase domain-containing protein [Candidatus Zixiibacteriota bacterium]|nr:MAG: UvrD-helicase domain-containing protein [candidate division Zixibacteria bacterium]
MSRLLKDLNPDQHEAVTTTAGPLLVIAGAGSGKTRVLTRRLAYILQQRLAEPYQILAVTFTNKAAGEMKERVWRLLGGEISALNVSTFHSFCARFLRREGGALGYDNNYTIFDESDSETLAKNCIKQLGLAGSQFSPKAQLRKISNAKNRMVGAETYAASASGYFEKATADIYSLYQKRLRECNAMDFDDLLFNSVTLLKNNREIGGRYRQRFQYLLVDEYQDTNHVQYLLLKHLLGDHQNICVVGDEDQSIYGWRGADIRNILEFEKDFPGAKIIKLEQNYRSTSIILDAASSVIENNEARKAKKLWTDIKGGEKLQLLLVDSAEEEAVAVVDFLKNERNGSNLKEMSILYRTNAQSRAFEEHLRRDNIPYQIVGGIAFYQRKEIKDLLAYLKLIVNIKDDVSFQRIINYPRRGVGAKSLEGLLSLAARESVSAYEILLKLDDFPELFARAKRVKPFVELIEIYRQKRESVPIDILAQDLVEDLRFLDELRQEDEIVAQTKIENVEAFIEGMAEYASHNGEATLENYLAEISLFTDLDSYREIEDKLTLMSLHSAKGLEFEIVFMVGLEEGLFPLGRAVAEPMELEEERRLFYVGATRAKKKLILSSATTRHRFGEVESIPSRFIKEIPENLVECHELRSRRRFEFDTGAFGTRGESPAGRRRATSPSGVHYDFEDSEIMTVGRIVQHPTFGRGKIIGAEGFGESLTLEIMFTGVGKKKIMVKYARLKIVG